MLETDTRFLYLWAEPGTEIDLEPIKEAKRALDLPFKVYPHRPTMDWQPEDGARLLAVGSRPPWVMPYFLVSERATGDELRYAVSWALGTHDDLDATDELDILNSILGPGVREIPAHELEAEAAFRRYQRSQ